jgi:hypothetical protein
LYRFALVDRFGERSLIDEAHDDRAAPAMPALKCSGVQRLSAASIASA